MFFKNLHPFRLSAEWPITTFAMREQLAKKTFQPCGSQDHESRGWVPPFDGGELVHAIGFNWLVCMQVEQRILPAAVVQREADKRAKRIEEEQGFKLGRKAMKELREQVTRDLLPHAFTRIRKTFAWMNVGAGWLVVDAASERKAEDVLELLRHSLDTFPLALLRTERSPMSAMADWLAGGAPDGFTLDQDFALQSISEDKARATFKGHDLEETHIDELLAAGNLPIKLAMTFDDRISFVLTESGALKRIDFLDVIRDQVKADEHEDAQSIFDAEFALMTGELLRMLPAVVAAMGGELTRTPDLIDNAKEQA